jgi:serine/threonine protein kinase
MTTPQRCPERAQWQNLLAGGLSPDAQATLTGHLDTCVNCQQTLEALASAFPAQPLGQESAPLESALCRAMAELKNEASEARTQPGPVALSTAHLPFLIPSDQPGHLGRLGPYEILEEIGRGGMGIVLKAFDEKLQRLVAIKVLAPHLAADDTSRQRFLREARAAAAIRHENVITIYAVEEAGSLPYLVMEYIAGPSLQDLLDRRGPPSLQEIVQIGAQTAAGLAAAHARGLVHRDVKPANILLETQARQGETAASQYRVKLTDFGLARSVDEAQMAHVGPKPQAGIDTRLTQVGVVAGTPQYMAPEQARGEPLDHRADLFSLGSVLYALGSGRSPFRGATLVAVLADVCEETPPPLRQLNPAVPGWLAELVAKLHAKEPARRYQTATEVADLLNRYLPTGWRPSSGFEYRSNRHLAGLPLVHIATGRDPNTGRMRVAMGIIAIGNVSVGVLALGGIAIGGIAVGGMSVGLLALGGGAFGVLLAMGGGAVGGIAMGGLAIGVVALGGGAIGYYALGGGVWAVHGLGGNIQDPQAVEFFRAWLGNWLPFPSRP